MCLLRHHSRLAAVVLGAAAMLATGCLDPSERLNAPPQGSTPRPNQMQDVYVYMVDNGMMHDMALSEIHFVPHTAQLSGTGVRRLNRYAELLEGYGGTLRLDTTEPDDQLNQARVSEISSYLASTGLNMTNVRVETGLSRGRGLDAPTAIRVLAEGTVDDTKAAGGAGPGRTPGPTEGRR